MNRHCVEICKGAIHYLTDYEIKWDYLQENVYQGRETIGNEGRGYWRKLTLTKGKDYGQHLGCLRRPWLMAKKKIKIVFIWLLLLTLLYFRPTFPSSFVYLMSELRTSFDTSFSTGLMVTSYLSFCLSDTVFILLVLWKYTFTGYKF